MSEDNHTHWGCPGKDVLKIHSVRVEGKKNKLSSRAAHTFQIFKYF